MMGLVIRPTSNSILIRFKKVSDWGCILPILGLSRSLPYGLTCIPTLNYHSGIDSYSADSCYGLTHIAFDRLMICFRMKSYDSLLQVVNLNQTSSLSFPARPSSLIPQAPSRTKDAGTGSSFIALALHP